MRWNRKAQSTVEYAVIVAVVVAAVLVMQVYMKRGISGKLKENTDQIGGQFTPYSATYSVAETRIGARDDNTESKGGSDTILTAETRGRTGNEEPVKIDIASEPLF